MGEIDTALTGYFRPAAPRRLARRVLRGLHAEAPDLTGWAERLRIDATERGVSRIRLDGGGAAATGAARRTVEQTRREIGEYLGGRRAFFSMPVDLSGVPHFQARVLEEARRIPFGAVASYVEIARRVGRPSAARAVGNALGANPVPVIVPCHRVIRGDGSWGRYLFGERLKTRLLALERSTPALVGCATTRIVCRHGCAHEQRVREDQRIVFMFLADAERVGYRPCRVCRPDAGPGALD